MGISRNTVRRYLRSGTIEPAYAERRSTRAIDKYAFQLSALLKTEAAKSRKQRRTLKQLHEDLKELGFEGSYDRVAAFARTWREGQTERVSPASKRTVQCLDAAEYLTLAVLGQLAGGDAGATCALLASQRDGRCSVGDDAVLALGAEQIAYHATILF